MKAVLAFVLGVATVLTLGAVATPQPGAPANRYLPVGTADDVMVVLGDTMVLKFSMATDTVLRLISGPRIVGRSCGVGHIYLRVWLRNGRDSSVLAADTHNIAVCIPRHPGSTELAGCVGTVWTKPLPPGCITDGSPPLSLEY